LKVFTKNKGIYGLSISGIMEIIKNNKLLWWLLLLFFAIIGGIFWAVAEPIIQNLSGTNN